MNLITKISREFIRISFLVFCCFFVYSNVSAKLFFITEENAINANNFIINADDSSSNFVDLEFGSALGVKMRYDILNDKFILNRSLHFFDDIRLDGAFLDKDGDVGLAGQVLSSTATGTDWITSSGGASLPTTCSNGEILKWNSTTTAWECNSDLGETIPYVDDVTIDVEISTTVDIIITGLNFKPTSIVSIPGWPGTINTTTILSPTEIELNVTAGAATSLYDVVVSNGGALNTFWSGNGVNVIDVHPNTWKDLRLGGDTFTDGNGAGNDIRYHSSMAMSRDANGMYFTGLNPWSSWVKFESLGWTRGANKTLEWIFTNPTGAMMIGIGSDATNETNTAQYAQAEVELYMNTATNMWGLYGNNGTIGSAGNQSSSTTLSSGGVYKAVFSGDGDAGDTFTLYQIPSAAPADWNDTSTIITTFTIGGTLNPNETNIMPFIIPRSGGTQRFIAVKVD